jgi:AraC family cel operon transcriptional repressor
MLVLDPARQFPANRSYTLQVQDSASAWHYPEHTHRGFGDLLVVERGLLQQRINGQEVQLRAGEAVLIRPSDRHALWGRGLRFLNLNIPVAEWDRLAAYAGGDLPLAGLWSASAPPRARLAGGDLLRILADLAELIVREHKPSPRAALAGFLLRWLPAFLASAGGNAAANRPDWLDPLLLRIRQGLGQGLAVTDLPRLAGVSQAHLSRCFRRHLGTSPSQHLNRLRLQQAALDLVRSERPVIDIGYRLGFSSPSYFYRLFTSLHGVPPATYRRRHRLS